MRFILTPAGSSGDVHPYLGIGRELKARGHDVVLVSAEPFKAAAERLGLGFVPVLSTAEYLAGTTDPDLWHPTRGVGVVMGMLAGKFREAYARIAEVYEPGRSVLVGHTIAFATRVFEETHGGPAATIHLAPTGFRSDHEQPALGLHGDLTRAPRWVKRAFWWLVDRRMVDPAVVPELNRWRAELGLPPVSRVFRQWLHSPRRVIALFPKWFAAPQPDWPPETRLAGFPLYDETPQEGLSPDIERFLAAGDPPIVFTPGTANRQAAAFFAAAVGASVRLGRRAVLLTPYRESVPAPLPDDVLHADYAPFSLVLPRASAVAHHGGIGTSAQALAAGVPQLVTPSGFDQPDNAMRLARLGVGAVLAPKRVTGTNVAATLARLVGDPAVADACARWRDALRDEDGIARACDLLEALAPSGSMTA